jgi:hypothetical protein
MPDPGRRVSKASRAALVAGVARALEEYDERPVTGRASSLSADQRLSMAIAEIKRVGAELRLEQALGEIERAADDLRTLAELHAERLVRPGWKRLASYETWSTMASPTGRFSPQAALAAGPKQTGYWETMLLVR